MTKVSIIILNYKQKELTLNCVKSVLAQGNINFEIILIDNNSKDGSAEFLEKRFGKNKKIRIIKNKKNRYYAGGNNIGIRKSHGKYVVILNNDTIAEKNWLIELLRFIELSGCEAVSSLEKRVIEGDKVAIDIACMRQNIFLHASKTTKCLPENNVEFINGGSFIMKRGWLFNEKYKIYAEETELALRIRNSGGRLGIAKKSSFIHYHNMVKKTNPGFRRLASYLGERNRIWNFRRYAKHKIIGFFPLLASMLIITMTRPRFFIEHLKAYRDGFLSHGWE